MADDILDDAKRFLKKEPSLGGTTLHDHLAKVLLKIAVEQPVDANRQFENICLALREPEEPLPLATSSDSAAGQEGEEEKLPEAPATEGDAPLRVKASEASSSEESGRAFDKAHAYFFAPSKPKEPVLNAETGEPEDPAAVAAAEAAAAAAATDTGGALGATSNVLDDALLWKWGGVSFGDEQTFRLFRSLQLLAGNEAEAAGGDLGGCRMRFWGKVLTRQLNGGGDYFIAEALTSTTSAQDPTAVDENGQTTGFRTAATESASSGAVELDDFAAEGVDGPNKYTYWASTDPAGVSSWTKLPHVTPQQVRSLDI